MARWVRLEKLWINLDNVASVFDDAANDFVEVHFIVPRAPTSASERCPLAQKTLEGEDAVTFRAALAAACQKGSEGLSAADELRFRMIWERYMAKSESPENP